MYMLIHNCFHLTESLKEIKLKTYLWGSLEHDPTNRESTVFRKGNFVKCSSEIFFLISPQNVSQLHVHALPHNYALTLFSFNRNLEGNKIEELPMGTFGALSNLQIL